MSRNDVLYPPMMIGWLEESRKQLVANHIKWSSYHVLALMTINKEAAISGRFNNLHISHASYKNLPIGRQTMNKVLSDLSYSGIILLDRRKGTSPLVDVIVTPDKFDRRKRGEK